MTGTAGAAPIIDLSTRRARYLFGFQCALLLYGLYSSFRIVFSSFGIEADTSHSVMLWYGIRGHGLGWVADWVFTQDNWLFSLVPFHFIGYAIFGPNALFAVGFGWVIFLLSAAIAAMIAWRLGARRYAPFVLVALVNLSSYAHLNGFVAYSTSHNITNLFGLGSFLVLIHWATRPRDRTLLLLLVLLTVAALSDPWMLAAFSLPIALGGVVMLARPVKPITRIAGLKLIAAAAFSIIATKTQFFTLFGFLPGVLFQLAPWAVMNANATFLVRDLGGLLNLVPGLGNGDFFPGIVSLLLVLGFLQLRVTRIVQDSERLVAPVCLLAGICAFAIGGIIAAFVLSNVEATLQSGRFVINCAYLAVIAVAVLAEIEPRGQTRWTRSFAAALLSFFVVSSVVSSWKLVNGTPFSFKDSGVAGITDMLRRHALTYGYGPYWGSLSNAVTAYSKGEIRVRPVLFSPINGRLSTGRPESSRRWYQLDDAPPGLKKYFVIVKNDGEVCLVESICVSGLIEQFGEPVETIHEGGFTILVWDHPLVNGKPPPVHGVFGETYGFPNRREFSTGRGWPRPDPRGGWTDGNLAKLRFKIEPLEYSGDVAMIVDSSGVLAWREDVRAMEVF